MILGYARVSTSDQPLHLQAYGCAEVVQEKVLSVKEHLALQNLLRPGHVADRVGVPRT